MRSIIAAVVVAAGVLGATCATEPRPVDPTPSPTAATPTGERTEGYWYLPRWPTEWLDREFRKLAECGKQTRPHQHCLGPVSLKDTWTVEDLLQMTRIADELAMRRPGNARGYYEAAVRWRIWARDVETRRRWPPHTCYGWAAEGHPGDYDCVDPDWQPSEQDPFDRP